MLPHLGKHTSRNVSCTCCLRQSALACWLLAADYGRLRDERFVFIQSELTSKVADPANLRLISGRPSVVDNSQYGVTGADAPTVG
jgi:hypothetical protein